MFSFFRKSLWLKRFIGDLPIVGKRYRNWTLYTHPFDREVGIETSGFVPGEEIDRENGRTNLVCYAGSQPGGLRRVLARLPDLSSYALVDLGCGKGRVLAVASEFPFRRIIGVELSSSLAAIARKNAEIIAAKFPQRTRIELFEEDAVGFVPDGRVVFYNFHSFQRELLERVLAGIEAGAARELDHAFFIYLNPVCADLFDRSDKWSRWAASSREHDKGELGFSFGRSDAIVVWQSPPHIFPPERGAERRVIINDAQWSAELEPGANPD